MEVIFVDDRVKYSCKHFMLKKDQSLKGFLNDLDDKVSYNKEINRGKYINIIGIYLYDIIQVEGGGMMIDFNYIREDECLEIEKNIKNE